MNRVLVGVLMVALLGWCHAAPHETGEEHKHSVNPGTVHTHEHDGVTHKHDHQDPDHAEDSDDVDPSAASEATDPSRNKRDSPRPGRPSQEDDDEDGSRTKELARPGQSGGDDQDEENDSNTKDLPRPGQGGPGGDRDGTGTKDTQRPSGIQTLPAKVPEGFRPSNRDEEEEESEE